MEYDAVILCGSSGSTLYPLTSESIPKCLLPIANRPLIIYQLELLQTANFTRAIIVTRNTYLNAIQSAIDDFGYSRTSALLSPVTSPSSASIAHPHSLHRGHSGGSDSIGVGGAPLMPPKLS